MSKKDTNWFQLDRYYTFEYHRYDREQQAYANECFCVGYYYRGTNCQNTAEFASPGERADFVRNELTLFRPFKP